MSYPAIRRTSTDHHRRNWSDTTRTFYEEHASEYAKATLNPPTAAALSRFASLVERGEKVADLGCGAGRDLKILREYRLRPVGLDYSFALCAIAQNHSGAVVVNGDIRRLPFANNAFQGVSAVASLLHLKKTELPLALSEVGRILRSKGVFFSSIKRGSGEYQDDYGRWFSYFEPEEWMLQLRATGFTPIEIQLNLEVRENFLSKEEICWISCLSTKS